MMSLSTEYLPNTVKGPSPDSKSTNPAASTAATNVVKDPLAMATSTIVPVLPGHLVVGELVTGVDAVGKGVASGVVATGALVVVLLVDATVALSVGVGDGITVGENVGMGDSSSSGAG